MAIQCGTPDEFLRLCRAHGIDPDAAMASLVSKGTDKWCADDEHQDFPKSVIRGGPGSELSKILACFFIKERSDCKCGQRALTMDRLGTKWCRENIDLITGWLTEEADRRKIPYTSYLIKSVVSVAISRAEAKEMSRVKRDPT